MMTETLEQHRRAEHLCLRCGRWDDCTEEGHRLCWWCTMEDLDREEQELRLKKCKSLRDVLKMHGYSYDRDADTWTLTRRRRMTSEQKKQYQRDLWEKRKSIGVCAKCGKAPAMTGKVLCRKCRDRERINEKRRSEKMGNSRLNTCPYAEGMEDLGEYACLNCPRPNSCIYDNESK